MQVDYKGRMRSKKKLLLDVIALSIFTLLAIWITFPLIFHLGDYITGYGDELSYTWIYTWAIHIVTSGNLFNLFNTNIFYPYNIALSNSDPNLISSLLALIPFLIIREPIVVVNFTVISSIIMIGFSLYLLTRYITKDYIASMFSGILVIFSPAYLSFYMHLQMFAIALVPLAILAFLYFVNTKKTRYWVMSLLFFVLQTYNNFLAGYFIIASYLIIFISHWVASKKIITLITKKNILSFIIAVLLIVPIALPYARVSKEFNYVRDIRESVHLALQPEDLLFSSYFSRLYPYINELPFNQISQNDEFKPGYLGVIFTLLVIVTVYFLVKNFRKKLTTFKALVIIGCTGLVLSAGPVLHVGRHTVHDPFPIPLPYALFYYIVPGFQGFRNSARWEMLFIIAFAVAGTITLTYLLQRVSFKTKVFVYCLLIIGVIAEFNFPMPFEKVPPIKDFPKVYSWLATTPKNIVYIEMPIYNWNMFPYGNIEFWRMYYSTIHFRRTVNGGGGFTPPPWQKMAYDFDDSFPSKKTIEKLKSIGVTYIIVHKDEYDMLNKNNFQIYKHRIRNGDVVLKELAENKNVKKINRFGEDYIFAL